MGNSKFFAVMAVVVLTAVVADVNAQPDPEAQPPRATPVARATPTGKDASPTLAESATPKVRPLAATITLSSGAELRGTLLDETELPMRTSFGQASIPLAEVAGIKMAQEGNSTTTVILHNGDTITGATDLARVNIETEWGKAQINGPNVNAILFTPGLSWVKDDTLTGDRWKLVEQPAQPDQPPTAQQRQQQQQSGGRRVVTSDGRVIRQFP
jgi:hypothetical protein